MTVLKILLLFGVFGFLFTFLREVVKDIEDVKGDMAMEARTLPIVLGISKTKTILVIVASLVLVLLALRPIACNCGMDRKYIGQFILIQFRLLALVI